jgi:hypothetical protein
MILAGKSERPLERLYSRLEDDIETNLKQGVRGVIGFI